MLNTLKSLFFKPSEEAQNIIKTLIERTKSGETQWGIWDFFYSDRKFWMLGNLFDGRWYRLTPSKLEYGMIGGETVVCVGKRHLKELYKLAETTYMNEIKKQIGLPESYECDIKELGELCYKYHHR